MRDHSKDSAKLTPAFIATGSILCLLFCSATAVPESAAANPNKDAAGVTLKAMSPKLDDSPTKPKPAPALKPTEMSETAMMAKGLKLSSDKRWDEAADVFKEVVAKNPRNVNAYYNLGSIAENRGDFDQALNFYKSAQGLSPNDSEIGEAVLAMKKKTGAAAGGGSLASNSAANQAGYPGSSNQPWQKKRHNRNSNQSSMPAAGNMQDERSGGGYGQPSIAGAPAGYVPTPSYYGTKSPPNSITANDPNYNAYQKQQSSARKQQMMRGAARMGIRGLRIGLRFL